MFHLRFGLSDHSKALLDFVFGSRRRVKKVCIFRAWFSHGSGAVPALESYFCSSLANFVWPLVTGIYPIPSAGSVYDDLVLFLHAFTPLITFGLICNSFRFACFVNSSLRFLIPNLHPICTCSCLFTPLTEGRSARDLTQAATSQKKFGRKPFSSLRSEKFVLRESSQSSDRGRPYVPRWDNPTGQLPGTGIPSGSDSGLHGTSRRRDSSVPERSRLRTSESGASAGESRPSLFDGLSSGFSPFGAVRNMGASEGASGTSTGGVSSGDNAQTLTAMANAAIVSQLQERARASLVGSAVGAEVFHIGSPSDQQGSEFQSRLELSGF